MTAKIRLFILWLIAYGLAILSGAWASRYGFMTADTFWTAVVKGGTLAAVSVFAVHSWGWASYLGHKGHRWAAVFTAVVGTFTFLVAIASGVGNLAVSDDAKTGERSSAIDSAKDARTDKKRLADELSGLGTFPPTDAVAVTAAKRAADAATTAKERECGSGDPKQRGPFCRQREADEKAANDRLTDAAAAKAKTDRAAEINHDLGDITKRLLNAPGSVAEADPHAARLSNLTFGRMDAKTAKSWYDLAVATAIELAAVSTMLVYEISSRHQPAPIPAAPQAPSVPAPAAALPPPRDDDNVIDLLPVGRVLEFLADVAEPHAGQEIDADQVYAIYLRWCERKGRAPLASDEFANEFADVCKEVGIKTREEGFNLYALDVGLVA